MASSETNSGRAATRPDHLRIATEEAWATREMFNLYREMLAQGTIDELTRDSRRYEIEVGPPAGLTMRNVPSTDSTRCWRPRRPVTNRRPTRLSPVKKKSPEYRNCGALTAFPTDPVDRCQLRPGAGKK